VLFNQRNHEVTKLAMDSHLLARDVAVRSAGAPVLIVARSVAWDKVSKI
jgi:hypothetical protein